MRALILAAGRTTGMGEPGNQQPKCMTKLAGKTLLERQIVALRGGGATEIGIVCGYRQEMIDYSDATRFENKRWAETGTAVSLATASAWLRSSPVLVSEGDVFFQHDLVHRLGSVRGTLAIAYDRQWRDLWARRFSDPVSQATTFRRSGSGTLLAIGDTTTNINEIEGQFMGLLKFTPVAWQAAEALLGELDPPTRDQLDIMGLLQRLLAAKSVPIGVVGTDGHWGKIDSPNDLALYGRMADDGQLALEG